MMRKTMMVAGFAAIMLPSSLLAAMEDAPPPQREPGSWSQQIELKRLEGKDADKATAAIRQMFAKMSGISVCVAPEMSTKEDPAANLEKLGGGGNCTFDRKSVAGGNVDISGTCKSAGGMTSKVTATGTMGASDQDINLTVESFDATDAKQGLMEMQVHSMRNGECTGKDMKAPVAAM